MKISVEHLTQMYGSHVVLDDVSFTTESGKVTALLGPNGSGKSTLIKTIADILPVKSETIWVNGKDITEVEKSERAKMIGYVPQYFHYTSFTSVLDTVLIGRRPYMSWSVSDEDLEAVDSALSTMHIEDLADRFVNELSGGQRQRVFIARALAQNPEFFLFDEPTSSLDLRHQLETLAVMQDVVHKNNSGMIVALHDLNLALRYADQVVLIKDGHVYADGKPADVLTAEAVRDVYGVESEVVEKETGRLFYLTNHHISMKKLFFAVLAVALVLASAGCVSQETEGLSLANTDGTTTVVPENSVRIVLLNSNAGEILYLLGEADRVVGISQSIANNAEQAKMYPNAKVIGAWNEPDVEYLISMGTDVVLAYSDSKPKNAEVLAAAGIPVVYVDCTKPDTMISDIREIGKLVGKEALAEEIAGFYTEVMDEVRAASMLASTHRTIYAESYTAWYGQGTDTGMGQMISWTFGENIMQDEGAKKLSDEWVVTANPEIIVKLVNNMDSAESVMQEIENRRGFDRVSAVEEDKVWLIRNDLTYGPRACVAAVALFHMQYPGISFDLTPEGVLAEFNERFGTEFETENITYPKL